MQPIRHAKTLLASAKRLQKTASIAALSGLRIAKGEKMDAWLLKETFEQLGTTYIKLGQFIASTPSLFPKEYVIAFADCLDNTTPIRFELVQAVLEQELAPMGGIAGVFAFIEPVALASASIAQVHKAVLKTGETVAIKVQKPNVDAIIRTDLGVLYRACWLLEKTVPAFAMTNLAPIVDEIKKRMLAETDFVAESRHLTRFCEFLQQTNNTAVIAPKVYSAYTTERVLVMEYIHGQSLLADTPPMANPEQLMNAILDTWFAALIHTGEFHADLHAGNLLALNNGQVAFLDFGLVGYIQPDSLVACLRFAQALSSNDFHLMAEAMIDIGMTHERQRMQPKQLAEDLQALLAQDNQKRHAQNPNLLISEITAIGKRHGIHFPRDFALLTKQLLYFERFMLTLAPFADILSMARLQLSNPTTNHATV